VDNVYKTFFRNHFKPFSWLLEPELWNKSTTMWLCTEWFEIVVSAVCKLRKERDRWNSLCFSAFNEVVHEYVKTAVRTCCRNLFWSYPFRAFSYYYSCVAASRKLHKKSPLNLPAGYSSNEYNPNLRKDRWTYIVTTMHNPRKTKASHSQLYTYV